MTRKRKLPIWKTSELALFFYGFDFAIGDSVQMQKESEMENVASALQIGLERDAKGSVKIERKLD